MALSFQSGYWGNMVPRFPHLEHLIVVMPDAMSCREHKRLRTDYEAALRR
jgi:hypothetical protein